MPVSLLLSLVEEACSSCEAIAEACEGFVEALDTLASGPRRSPAAARAAMDAIARLIEVLAAQAVRAGCVEEGMALMEAGSLARSLSAS